MGSESPPNDDGEGTEPFGPWRRDDTIAPGDSPTTIRGEASRPDWTVPIESFGPYRAIEVLGKGGMGIVYRARDERTGQEVAVKTVLGRTQGLLNRIRREVHALSRIRHPGFVAILETGLESGQPWYAMELLRGITLRDFLVKARQEAPQPATTPLAGSRPHPFPVDLTRPEPSAPDESIPTEAIHEGETVDPFWSPDPLLDTRPIADDEEPRAAGGPPAGRLVGADLREYLRLVARLSASLAYLHGQGIVHRDLKPPNIMIRPDGSPVLLDFGLASSYGTRGREVLEVGGSVEGTPSYMSPEQIGGELVDARADLYAVGCMLYEGVTGRTPFRRKTTLATLRAHLDEPAVPPGLIAPELPPALDALILKLLAKRARDRVGYAQDVVAALEAICGAVGSWAEGLPARDYLYRPGFVGRAAILLALETHVEAILDGPGRCVFVRGRSGVGKTRAVLELGRVLGASGRIVIACECPPIGFGGEASGLAVHATPLHPFRPLLQAVADACVEFGPEEASRLLGSRGRILAECEPALASFADSAPVGPGIGAGDGRRERLLDALGQTLARFAGRAPLVLILDDLQWADELTLDFLAMFHRGTWDIREVAMVGAFRAEEEAAVWRGNERTFRDAPVVDVGPLDVDGLREVVGDILGSANPEERFVRHLAGVSEGNPFFLAEYLRAAVAEGFLIRDDGRWVVREPVGGDGNDGESPFVGLPLPGSLQDLIARRLDGLAPADRRLLGAMAVIGREVDEDLLGAIGIADEAGLLDGLNRLLAAQVLEEGRDGAFRFLHDKLREVSYARIPADRLRDLHHRVAMALEARGEGASGRCDAVLAQHWHRSIGDPRAETDRVARALLYLERSLGQATRDGMSRDAVEYGLAAARLLDLDLPGDPEAVAAAIPEEIARVMRLLDGRRPADLLGMPAASDPRIDRISSLLQAIHPPAHMSNQYALSALAAAKNLALTLESGHGALAPAVYAMAAILARNVLDDARLGDEFVRLAEAIDESRGGAFAATVAMIRSWFSNHWVRPLREGLATSRAGAEAGFARGDHLYGCFCHATHVVLLAASGETLDRVEAVAEEAIEAIGSRVYVARFHAILERQFVRALKSATRDAISLSDDRFDEARDLASILQTTNSNQIAFYHTYKLRLLYLAGHNDEALARGDDAFALVFSIMGQPAEIDLTFYRALALLAQSVEDDESLAKARTLAATLHRWADGCESNFRHKALLVDAEVARVEGRSDEVSGLYDRASVMAEAGGFLQDAALARERAGRHHEALRLLDAANADYREALRLYGRWGAERKVAEIAVRLATIGQA